jgi:Effector Associated Constant Component 1
MTREVEVGLAFRNERYDSDDPRWRDQVADLMQELRLAAGSVQIHRTPVPGTKGTVDQLILTLGSAGVFTTAVDVLRVWLARDRHRSVEVTVTGADGRPTTVRVDAENANSDAFAPVYAAAAKLAQEA